MGFLIKNGKGEGFLSEIKKKRGVLMAPLSIPYHHGRGGKKNQNAL